jgi:error-prone DNA polymerase
MHRIAIADTRGRGKPRPYGTTGEPEQPFRRHAFADEAFLFASQQRTKGEWGRPGPAVRLGFRVIKGLRKEEIEKLIAARRDGPFRSIEELHRRTHLSSAAIDTLAEADAFGSMGRTRRSATWESLAVTDTPMDLFDSLTPLPSPEEARQLPSMSLGQEVLADYATTSLSLKAHPISLMRDELKRRGVITSEQLGKRKIGWVKVAGLVLLRQRPGTASGIVFMTLEDETGIVNLIVRPKIFDEHLAAARHGRILLVEGRVERSGKVIHVMARRLFDIGNELESGSLFRSRDFH